MAETMIKAMKASTVGQGWFEIQWRFAMEPQFVTDAQGNKTGVIIPLDEWGCTEKAKAILEHVYLAELIKNRRDSRSKCGLDDLIEEEGLSRAELES